jgi:tRNA A-37 threonylcarbamoyl transferase component Bud32
VASRRLDLPVTGPALALPRRLRHGYTNETWADGTSVWKHYLGFDGQRRMRQELAAIEAVGSVVPTPRVISVHPSDLRVEFARVDGRPGQALIESGLADNVLTAAGRTLAVLHSAIGVTHGDYGPQNLLFDPAGEAVVLVADWEFSSSPSESITDLAWAEWIVRMHHPDAVASINALFEGFGQTPPWNERKQVMLRRCEWLRQRSEAAGDPAGQHLWAQRLAVTEGWPSLDRDASGAP